MILFRCPKCGERSADLEGHRCVPASDRLAKARAALAEAERKEGPVEDERAREALAGVREEMRRRAAPPSEPPSAPPAPVEWSGGRAVEQQGFDRAKYQREYMRGWRARRRAKAPS